MATAAQIEANIVKDQLSTGPRTVEGNAASATNSTKHGFTAKHALQLTEDDRQEWQALVSANEYELRSSTPIVRTMSGTLVLAAWNIQRANRLEAAMAINGIDPLLSGEQDAKKLDRIGSFRMRAKRTFRKSHKELRALIAARPPLKAVVKNEPKFMVANCQGNAQPWPERVRHRPSLQPPTSLWENEANSAQLRNHDRIL